MSKFALQPITPFVGREAELRQLHHIFSRALADNKPQLVLIQGDFGVGKTALVKHFLTETAASNAAVIIGEGKCALEKENNGLIPFSQALKEVVTEWLQWRSMPENRRGDGKEKPDPQFSVHHKIVEFLTGLPNMDDSNAQRALLYSAGLDQQLQRHVQIAGPPAEFFQVLITTLSRYGKLQDGRHAIAAILEAAKNYVGQEGQAYCDRLIQEVQQIPHDLPILESLNDMAPAWSDIMTVGTTHEAKRLLQGGNAFSQENVFYQFTNALQRLAENQPMILFIDDLHWADASSLTLLFHVARYLQDRAVLVLCTYRPVEALETGTNAPMFREIRANLLRYGAAELELRQGINVADYAAQRYPAHAFAPELLARVQELTDGYALFVSQVFSLWEDTGVLKATPTPDGQTKWELARDAEASPVILPTLSAVLDERIRLMEDGLRDMLTCASVEGEDFTAQVVASLRQLDDTKVFDNLETLQHRYRLIHEQGSQDAAATVMDFYRFAHRFFREHVYQKLSGGKRRMLHKQVAECLEALYHGQDDIAGQLAQHFREAHEPQKAAQYALKAAKFEQTRYAWSEVEQWCEFGLALLDKLPINTEMTKLRLDFLEQSGVSYYISGLLTKAQQQYREALMIAQAIQANAEKIAGLCDKLSGVCELEGLYDEAIKFIEQGRKTLIDCSVTFGEIHVALEASWAFMQVRFGNCDLAVQYFHKLLFDLKSLPNTYTLEKTKSEIYNMLGIVFGDMGRYAESIAAFQESIDLDTKIGNTTGIVSVLFNIAEIYLKIGELNQSMSYIERGEQICQKVGDLGSAVYAKAIKGDIFLALGKFGESVNILTEAIMISEQIGAFWNMLHVHATLALAYLGISEIETAYQKALCAIKYAEKIPYQIEVGYALDALAQVEVARQDWESAIQHFQQAIDKQKGGHRHFEARTQRRFAEAMIKQGKTQEAVALLQTALKTFQELNLEYEIAATQKVLSNVSLALPA